MRRRRTSQRRSLARRSTPPPYPRRPGETSRRRGETRRCRRHSSRASHRRSRPPRRARRRYSSRPRSSSLRSSSRRCSSILRGTSRRSRRRSNPLRRSSAVLEGRQRVACSAEVSRHPRPGRLRPLARWPPLRPLRQACRVARRPTRLHRRRESIQRAALCLQASCRRRPRLSLLPQACDLQPSVSTCHTDETARATAARVFFFIGCAHACTVHV